jgi:hypothetical protein
MASGTPREAIRNEDVLLRRVYAGGDNYFREDGTATPLAFNLRKSKGEKGLSVDLSRMTTLEASRGDKEKFVLCELTAAHVRSLSICACHDPNPPEDPDNGAHALIIPFSDKDPLCGDLTGEECKPPVMLTSSVRDRLAKGARLVRIS